MKILQIINANLKGKNKLTVPKYNNVCDALCHMRINKKMGICPEAEDGEPTPILPENYK